MAPGQAGCPGQTVPAVSWEGMQAPLHEPRCSGQLSRYTAYL